MGKAPSRAGAGTGAKANPVSSLYTDRQLGETMTKRQLLLRLRDDTETQLSASRSDNFDLLDEQSDDRGASFAAHLKDLSGVVSLLDLRLAVRALDKSRH